MKLYEFAESFDKEVVMRIVDKNEDVLYEGKAGALYSICIGNVNKETGTVIDGVVQVGLKQG